MKNILRILNIFQTLIFLFNSLAIFSSDIVFSKNISLDAANQKMVELTKTEKRVSHKYIFGALIFVLGYGILNKYDQIPTVVIAENPVARADDATNHLRLIYSNQSVTSISHFRSKNIEPLHKPVASLSPSYHGKIKDRKAAVSHNPRFLITGLSAGRQKHSRLDIRHPVDDAQASRMFKYILQLASDLPGENGHHIHIVGREDQYLLAMMDAQCIIRVDYGNGTVSDDGHTISQSFDGAKESSYTLPIKTDTVKAAAGVKAPPTCSYRFDSLAVRSVPRRTSRLAAARNQYLEVAARNDFDFMIVFDLDVNCYATYNATILSQLMYLPAYSALSFLAPTAVYEEQKKGGDPDEDHHYWDLYALDPAASAAAMNQRITHVRKSMQQQQYREGALLKAVSQLPFKSSFMTAATYRVASFSLPSEKRKSLTGEDSALTCHYEGKEKERTVCEHVPFHHCLGKSLSPELAIFPCSHCRDYGPPSGSYYDFCPGVQVS